jgi:hypothetical protein
VSDELFQDTELALITWVKTVEGVAHAGSVTDTTLSTKLTFVRVMRIGGQDDGVTDRAVVDIDVLAATRGQAWLVAERIRAGLQPRTRAGAAIIDSVRTSVSPRQLPWSNDNIKRYSATYGITLRR